ncbi:MAG TPA: hypothetical protein VMI54_04315 [Polyangiaceae bacterium]|nr:hypothetical protein [Polyangiaceae bacterium]
MTRTDAPLEQATADAPPALPFRVRAWSLDPSAAVPSELTGRKLLFIVLGLTASWLTLLAGALLGSVFLIAYVVDRVCY